MAISAHVVDAGPPVPADEANASTDCSYLCPRQASCGGGSIAVDVGVGGEQKQWR